MFELDESGAADPGRRSTSWRMSQPPRVPSGVRPRTNGAKPGRPAVARVSAAVYNGSIVMSS